MSYPFNTQKQTKGHQHHHYHIHQPKNLIYPEISTLSAIDIANNLEFLYQNRRIPSPYDGLFRGLPPLWGQHLLFGNWTVPGLSGLPGMGRLMGVAINDGPPLSPLQTQPMMSLRPPSPLTSDVPAWLGLKSRALAWLRWPVAWKFSSQGRGPWPRFGLAWLWLRPWLSMNIILFNDLAV